jgi:RHS repeat-associated protein
LQVNADPGPTENPFQYVGKQGYYRDPELELYLLGGSSGGRYYDPAAGRFLSADPLGFSAGDDNLYRYVRNNPVTETDPSGQAPIYDPGQCHCAPGAAPQGGAFSPPLGFSNTQKSIDLLPPDADASNYHWETWTVFRGGVCEQVRVRLPNRVNRDAPLPAVGPPHESTDGIAGMRNGDGSTSPQETARPKHVVKVEVVTGFWTWYNEESKAKGGLPWYTNFVVDFVLRPLFPESEPGLLYTYDDGSTMLVPGGGPSGADLLRQFAALAATTGIGRFAGGPAEAAAAASAESKAAASAAPATGEIPPVIVSVPGTTGSFDTIPAGQRLTTHYPPNRGFLRAPSTETLQPGTLIDRFGTDAGRFASPLGTPTPLRSLPYGAAERPYNSFRVVKPFDVQTGSTAPWFGQMGGGTQYELPASVQSLLNSGHLERVSP